MRQTERREGFDFKGKGRCVKNSTEGGVGMKVSDSPAQTKHKPVPVTLQGQKMSKQNFIFPELSPRIHHSLITT